MQDGFFYFCKLGHKFYATTAQENRYRTGMKENELLRDRGSFKIPMEEVSEIRMETERDPWTASDDNHGNVRFRIGGRERRFILGGQTPPALLAERLKAGGFDRSTLVDNAEPTGYREAPDKKADRADTKKVARLTRILNALTAVASAWVLLLPYGLTGGAAFCVLLPIAALLAQWKFRGFFRSRTRNSAKANGGFFTAVLLPPLILCIKVIVAVHVVYMGRVFLILLALTIFCTAVCLLCFRRLRSKKIA